MEFNFDKIQKIYALNSIELNEIEHEKESQDYGAARFKINDKYIVFRSAKITPTKTGQFVTLWKRLKNPSIIAPLDSIDNIDYLIVNVSFEKKFGQFIFDKRVLIEKNILTSQKEGKRAFRLYPPWDKVTSKIAASSQAWQQFYFYDLGEHPLDSMLKIKSLFLK